MFKKLLQSKKAQQTAEYAILIALVVGAVIAMQTYAQRTIQARIRGASSYLSTAGGNVLGTDLQYEPYYLNQTYAVTRDEETSEIEDDLSNKVTKDMTSNRTRGSGGYQTTAWNGDGAW
jgi:hypothetical protein